MVSVSYAPAQIGDQLRTSRSDHQRADQLHALVATSAKFGVFRIDGPSEIQEQQREQLANAIRLQKPVDMTLHAHIMLRTPTQTPVYPNKFVLCTRS